MMKLCAATLSVCWPLCLSLSACAAPELETRGDDLVVVPGCVDVPNAASSLTLVGDLDVSYRRNVSCTSSAAISVDDTFSVRFFASEQGILRTGIDAGAVVWTRSDALEAVLPSTLTDGDYKVVVVDPKGHTLSGAFRVGSCPGQNIAVSSGSDSADTESEIVWESAVASGAEDGGPTDALTESPVTLATSSPSDGVSANEPESDSDVSTVPPREIDISCEEAAAIDPDIVCCPDEEVPTDCSAESWEFSPIDSPQTHGCCKGGLTAQIFCDAGGVLKQAECSTGSFCSHTKHIGDSHECAINDCIFSYAVDELLALWAQEWTGSWKNYQDTYVPEGKICGVSQPSDVWFEVSVPPSSFVRIAEQNIVAQTVIRLIESCSNMSCLQYAESPLYDLDLINNTAESKSHLIVISPGPLNMSPKFDLLFSLNPL